MPKLGETGTPAFTGGGVTEFLGRGWHEDARIQMCCVPMPRRASPRSGQAAVEGSARRARILSPRAARLAGIDSLFARRWLDLLGTRRRTTRVLRRVPSW